MTKKNFTLGVLTSGGDSPGMNAAIRAVVRSALFHEANVLGVMSGFEGLINGEYNPMGARDVGGILQRGGTILQTRRSQRFFEKSFQREAIRNMSLVVVAFFYKETLSYQYLFLRVFSWVYLSLCV